MSAPRPGRPSMSTPVPAFGTLDKPLEVKAVEPQIIAPAIYDFDTIFGWKSLLMNLDNEPMEQGQVQAFLLI
eukprot:CAMPEP_0168610838 /NCGR_PEP_ID=MMETSP0449_2-20121227/2014_1 /TAXON_ID=1082188 /ORGANISM="Strombidium rassoulzadegani, Strain ras09" /LENGTH=71 /DNA_ID=CAMNT_0008651197 /DNA_START=56 /DNA_END=271 /DNA_ORIENTATION=-